MLYSILTAMKLRLYAVAFFLFVLCCTAPGILAQRVEKDSRGTEFWFTFLPNLHVNNPTTDSLYIYVAATEPTVGRLLARDRFGRDSIIDFTITDPTQVYKFQFFWRDYELKGSVPSLGDSTSDDQTEQPAKNLFYLTTEKEVTVYALNQATTTSDAFLVLPSDVLGKKYRVMAYNADDGGGGAGTPSEFVCVATQDNTTLEIAPAVITSRGTRPDGFSIVLQQGESLLMQSRGPNNNTYPDLTGSLISADKPIAVFSGQQRAKVPVGVRQVNSRDHIVEQMNSINTWGKSALIVPFRQPANGQRIYDDQYRVLAAYDSTVLFVNGLRVTTLQAGGIFEGVLVDPHLITSNKPILVAQYKKSSGNGTGALGDPFMMLIPPPEQFQEFYRFVNVQAVNYYGNDNNGIDLLGYREQYVTVLMPNTAIASTKLDGVNITSRSDTIFAIPGTTYSYTSMKVSDGAHTIESSEPVGIYVYGYGRANSYGYVGGMSYRSFDFSNPQANGQQLCNSYRGVIYDTLPGDTRVAKVDIPQSGLQNVHVASLTAISKPVDSAIYQLELINPYLDGKAQITGIDSVQQEIKQVIDIKGFTVATKQVGSTSIPEFRSNKLLIGSQACYSIEVENYGKFDQTINPAFAGNGSGYFTITGDIPKTLKPGEKYTYLICFKSDQEAELIDTLFLANTCTQRPLVAFRMKVFDDKIGPVITAQSDPCKTLYTFTVTDSTENDLGLFAADLDAIQSINCVLSSGGENQAALRSITIRIPDPRQDAILVLRAEDQNRNVTYFRDTIPGYTLRFVNFAENAPYDYKFVPVAGVRCDSMMLENYGRFPLTLNQASLSRNLRFSVPLSQFPFTIPPGSVRNLYICYNPNRISDTFNMEMDRDTLVLGARCINSNFYLQAQGADDINPVESKCKLTVVTAITGFAQDGLYFAEIFPNPLLQSVQAARIHFGLGTPGQVQILLHSAAGGFSRAVLPNQQMQPGVYNATFGIDNVPAGMYFCEIRCGIYSKVLPLMILE
jgi:hypothetical protein